MKLFFIEPGGAISQIDELVALFSVVFFFVFSRTFMLRFVHLRLPIAMFSVYFVVSIISSVFGVVVFNQFLLQLFLDLKPFIIMFLVFLCFDDRAVDRFEYLLKALILINVPFVIWQLGFGGSYDFVFSNGSHFGLIYGADGSEYARAAGVFWFTGGYAVFCALAVGFFVSKFICNKKVNFKELAYLCTALILLTLSLSRGEIFSCLVASLLVYFIYFGSRYIRPITVIGVFSLFVVVLVLYSVDIEKWLVELGVLRGAIDLAPRAIFMQTALDISANFFPLGAGLGAFGGKAAVDYDSFFFYEYLISHEWYFNFGYFLTDTFWPKVLAESGSVGTVFYLMAYLAFIRKAMETKSVSSVYSLFALTFILVNSFSAPVLNDAFSIALVFFLYYGAFEKRNSNEG